MLNNEFFLVFVLAHLIGDFVLQTNKISKMKSEDLKGLAIHCAVIAAVQMALLSVFGLPSLSAGLLVAVAHFFIDWGKNAVIRNAAGKNVVKSRAGRIQLPYFLLDQAVHFVVIWAAAYVLSPGPGLLQVYLSYIKLLVGFIILTWVSTVVVKILLRDVYPEMSKKAFFLRRERIPDALTALVLSAALLSPMHIGAVLIPVLFPAYLKLQKRRFNYTAGACLVKYLAYALIAAGVAEYVRNLGFLLFY